MPVNRPGPAELRVIDEMSRVISRVPQAGQRGFLHNFTLRHCMASALTNRSRPTSGSPAPTISFTAPVAWTSPTSPRRTPRTPPSAHGEDEAGQGRLRIQTPIAGAVDGAEDGRLALEPTDGAIHIGLAEKDAGVVHEVAGLKVIAPVNDQVMA